LLDGRYKKAFSNFIEDTANEDFTIYVNKEEIVFSLGLKLTISN